jgi:hypothetical protein
MITHKNNSIKPFKIGQLVQKSEGRNHYHRSDGLFLVLEIKWDSHYSGWWMNLYSQQMGDFWQTWSSNLDPVGEKR